jgi:hypothetical protein
MAAVTPQGQDHWEPAAWKQLKQAHTQHSMGKEPGLSSTLTFAITVLIHHDHLTHTQWAK